MGCQTGFYLVLFNFGEAEKVCQIYEMILLEILQSAKVPYADPANCGQAVFHTLSESQDLAKTLLKHKNEWRQVL